MAQCAVFATIRVGGSTSTALVLQPAPASQTPINCTGYVLLSRDEFSALQNPFFVPLSIADGVLISGAILTLWAMAWVYRNLGIFLNPSSHEEH